MTNTCKPIFRNFEDYKDFEERRDAARVEGLKDWESFMQICRIK